MLNSNLSFYGSCFRCCGYHFCLTPGHKDFLLYSLWKVLSFSLLHRMLHNLWKPIKSESGGTPVHKSLRISKPQKQNSKASTGSLWLHGIRMHGHGADPALIFRSTIPFELSLVCGVRWGYKWIFLHVAIQISLLKDYLFLIKFPWQCCWKSIDQ